MIRKIQSSEYLRRVDNMDGAEREAYLKRVGEWLQKRAPLLTRRMDDLPAVFQDAMQCSAGWNDDECTAWNEGARLLSALSGQADTWLPDMLYTKSAKRAIRNMIKTLTMGHGPFLPCKRPLVQRDIEHSSKAAKEEPADKARKGTQAVAALPAVAQQDIQLKPVPVRPKHIDQYVHLLPQKTQERAATVKGLLRDLDVAREKMRLLMDDQHASDDSRAQWAKAATALDTKVKAIYRELDAEWEKLVQSGRVVVDDLGNARVVDKEPAVAQQGTQPDGDNAQQDTKAQIKSLRSWLRDNRGPKEPGEKHDAYVARWKEKYREMVRLGGYGTVTEAVTKAAELYGIQLDKIVNP